MSGQTYADWLNTQLREKGFSARSFARAWNTDDPETARRMLQRYLKGAVVPTRRTRGDIARVLGSVEAGPPDDSEADRRGG